MHRLNSVALLVALLALPLRLSAQSIHGELLELESRNPVEGALVLLVDERGAEAAGVFTNAHGRFLLQAPAPGRYSIRAERIGLKTTSSPVVSVGAGAAVEQRLLLPLEVRKLEALEVEAESRCTVRPEGERTAVLWESARKALSAARWGQGLYRFRLNQFQRRLDPANLVILREESTVRSIMTSEPYQSLPAEKLAREGYRTRGSNGDFIYNAPDAKVLLSESFLNDHCFVHRAGDEKRPGLVGLAFQPVKETRGITDVTGVLWIDPNTEELRSLEFTYTNLSLRGPVDRLGGEMRFERLPEGPWIVRQWAIRMPVMGSQQTTAGGVLHSSDFVAGIREVGAEVTEIIHLQAPKKKMEGEITGTVLRKDNARPIAGGTVFLDGTSFSAQTDAEGRFRITGVREGRYTVRFFHPEMDSTLEPRELQLGRGESAEVELRLP